MTTVRDRRSIRYCHATHAVCGRSVRFIRDAAEANRGTATARQARRQELQRLRGGMPRDRGYRGYLSVVRSPVVRDIDEQSAPTAWASEVEDPYGQPGPHSQADRGVSLEASAPRDLTEGRVPRDVGELLCWSSWTTSTRCSPCTPHCARSARPA